MKSFQYLSLLFFLAEEVSNVKALPSGTVTQTLETVDNVVPLDPMVEVDTKRNLETTVNTLLGKILPGAGSKRNTERDSPLEGIGELVGSLEPILELPHIPLGSRDVPNTVAGIAGTTVDTATNIAENVAPLDGIVKRSVLKTAKDAVGNAVNLDKAVPLDAFKKITTKGLVGNAQNIAGHAIPHGLVGSLAGKARSILDVAGGVVEGAESLTGELPVVGKDKRATFNSETQRIDVTGAHAFVPPNFENGDTRGPCPGLNALANHGYIPHNGVASIAEYIVATNSVFGMGIDISTVLAVYGTVEAGNPLSLNPGFSIGGVSDASQNLLGNIGGLLGTPRGLDGTHNAFEEDASGTRGDLYDAVGDNHNLNMSYFMDLYNLQKDAEEPNYSMDILLEHNKHRFEQSEATNPYFFYGPGAGLVVRNAAYAFTGRLFANTSEEHPEGILNKETLKSFFAVYGPEDNMTYQTGWERIPDVWYRRSGDYSLASYAVDLVEWATKYPRLLSIGGNTNGVNTFTGIDLANLTGGLMNTADLLQGNNLICFGFEFVKEFSPSSLSSLFSTIATPLQMILDVVDSTLLSLDCPDFKDLGVNGTDFTEYLKATYPGAAKSGGAS